MITVSQSDSILEKNPASYPAIRVPLRRAAGCVLREHVVADRDFPPFDRATMDGIAISSTSCLKGVLPAGRQDRKCPVEGLQKAGAPALSLRSRNACLEITTGAGLPKGCDCVVPVEYVEMDGRVAKVSDEFKARPFLNVHRKGSDARKGDILLRSGCRLATAQIAVAAAVGKAKILVTKIPTVALVGTGDELVEIDQPVKPFEIRRSNTCALSAGLALNGCTSTKRFHIQDDQKKLRAGLKKILQKYDVIILSGGVSKGKLDFVPRVLEELGVTVLFHKVQQRPGGPLLFGKTSNGKPVFGLPGNPVSTQICFYRYVLPYLNEAIGLATRAADYVTLSEAVTVKTALTYFLPVAVTSTKDGRLTAAPVFPQNSGDLVSLTKSDGFVELPAFPLRPRSEASGEARPRRPPETFRFRKGSVYPFYKTKD